MAPLLLPSLDSEPVTLATAEHTTAITHWSKMSTSFRQLSSNPAKCHCLDGSPVVFKSSCQGVEMQLVEACLAHTKPWVQTLAHINWALWCMPIGPALGTWRQTHKIIFSYVISWRPARYARDYILMLKKKPCYLEYLFQNNGASSGKILEFHEHRPIVTYLLTSIIIPYKLHPIVNICVGDN